MMLGISGLILFLEADSILKFKGTKLRKKVFKKGNDCDEEQYFYNILTGNNGAKRISKSIV